MIVAGFKNDYYPFGLQQKGYNNVVSSTNPAQNYTYNGKEKQGELGLDLLDYGNRNYDAALGRFITIDRFTQKYLDKSPYHYGANTPILYADKVGDSIIVTNNERLYDGTDKNGYVESVRNYGDVGETYLASTSWVYNETTKEIDATFYIQENFTPFLTPGSVNRFIKKNPGIRREAYAHENGHYEQFTEVIKNSTDFSVKLDTHEGVKKYSGGVQEILDAIYSDYKTNLTNALEKFEKNKKNPFKLTEKGVKDFEDEKLTVNVRCALNSLEDQIKDKALNYPDKKNDANRRSYKSLGGKNKSKYNSGRKSIIFWGF